MPLYIRDAGTWKQFPTTPAGGRPVRVRDLAAWKTAVKLFVRDNGVWRTESEYTFKPAAPTNFRSTSTSTDYNGVSLAWDYAGLVTPKRWILGLWNYDDSPSNTPWYEEIVISDPAARTYRLATAFTNYPTYYSFVLAVESTTGDRIYFGTGTSTPPANTAGVKWKIGYASYTVNDIPIYGWADTWEWTPPLAFESSNFGAGYEGSRAVDNNNGTRWQSGAHSSTGTVNDWEGIWVRMPYWAHHKYVGLRIIQEPGLTPCWLTHGVYYSNTWQGSVNQPIAAPPCHPWLVHANISYYTVAQDQYLYEGDYVTDGGSNPGGNLASIMLGANLTTGGGLFGYYALIREVRMLLQNWRVVSYGPRTIAAVPSAAW